MSSPLELTEGQRKSFNQDGFVVVENILDSNTILRARKRFDLLFAGEFNLGIEPDEWNWREGRDAPDLTRQICNAWKSDSAIRPIVLREDIGKACAMLRDWPGARINQDNVIWKPPGARSLGFHQDDSFQNWIDPPQMMTCWITLDDTLAEQGTIEYVRGSHLWPVSPPITQFHAPNDPQYQLRAAAKQINAEIDIVPIEVQAGTAVFHHGRTWHGSNSNNGLHERRSVVSHCMSSAATFSDTNTSPVYSRYKQVGSNQMDESFFPILYRGDGYRTPWLNSIVGVNE